MHFHTVGATCGRPRATFLICPRLPCGKGKIHKVALDLVCVLVKRAVKKQAQKLVARDMILSKLAYAASFDKIKRSVESADS
jgi:hypothetical protein